MHENAHSNNVIGWLLAIVAFITAQNAVLALSMVASVLSIAFTVIKMKDYFKARKERKSE